MLYINLFKTGLNNHKILKWGQINLEDKEYKIVGGDSIKANDTQIRVFLEGSKQFVVPLYQREYVWEKKDIERLWEDIKETETNYYKMDQHFFGSFVTMPTPSGASTVSEFTVVDGQQRLTTIYI